jgi:hypothetical protein
MYLLEDAVDSIIVNNYKIAEGVVLFDKLLIIINIQYENNCIKEVLNSYLTPQGEAVNSDYYFSDQQQTKITKLDGKLWELLYG